MVMDPLELDPMDMISLLEAEMVSVVLVHGAAVRCGWRCAARSGNGGLFGFGGGSGLFGSLTLTLCRGTNG